ncbi:MAG: S8 family peptidase [Trueperaceae bacterium]
MVKRFGLSLPICFFGVLLALAACTQVEDSTFEQLGLQRVGETYIVVLDTPPLPGNAALGRSRAEEVARAHGLQPEYLYGAALVGFAADVPAGRLEALRRDPRVSYVERDAPVTIFGQETPTGITRIFADGNELLSIDGSDDARVDVDVAVIDTGVDFEHPDLNVVGGVDCSGGGPFGGTCGSGGDDDHYHGTHVAGTIAALDNGTGVVGVAPGARIWAVKVLDSRGSGYTSWIVAGIDWVAEKAETIEVANMSLGGSGFSQAQYDAIQGAVNVGVAFAVAAGNSDDDANNYSPAAFDNVLTVSALADFDGIAGGDGEPTCRDDQDDTLADFSNWGDAVQIAAPGVCILSTYPVEQGEYGTISGTSMASPHGAGALALLASSNNPANAVDVHALYDQVVASGNVGWLDDSGDGFQEPLLDVSDKVLYAPTLITGSGDGGGDGGGGEGGDASITLSASGYKVRGVHHADLAWDGATSTDVDVYRDETLIGTTANDGAYTDNIGAKGGGSYTYQVCEAGTSTCSGSVTVTF